jgi:hypothetical protein
VNTRDLARAFVEAARIGELCDQWRALTDRIGKESHIDIRGDLIDDRDAISDEIARALIEACAWEDQL